MRLAESYIIRPVTPSGILFLVSFEPFEIPSTSINILDSDTTYFIREFIIIVADCTPKLTFIQSSNCHMFSKGSKLTKNQVSEGVTGRIM